MIKLDVLSHPSYKAQVVHDDHEFGSWLPAGINADRSPNSDSCVFRLRRLGLFIRGSSCHPQLE